MPKTLSDAQEMKMSSMFLEKVDFFETLEDAEDWAENFAKGEGATAFSGRRSLRRVIEFNGLEGRLPDRLTILRSRKARGESLSTEEEKNLLLAENMEIAHGVGQSPRKSVQAGDPLAGPLYLAGFLIIVAVIGALMTCVS